MKAEDTEYELTVGLEVHAELKTVTKMFCSSRNDPDEARPNQNICPVCMSHPGTLPVINKEAVRHVLRVGSAIGGTLADYTEFDRKNYFYPDLPKGYQISQYEYPLVLGGMLAGVEITRVHLEEDTARSAHASATAPTSGGDDNSGSTMIDYNRAGVPLMELVTEPVIKSAAQAGAFARELRLLLRTLGASDANMEKGEMRVEANISIQRTENGGQRTEGRPLGTKVEVKNLNSIRAAERAIAYEFTRQKELLASGGKVVQETRGWDENKQQTFSQRIKETSADYRYFPDPDLPSLVLSEIPEFTPAAIRASLPQLPDDMRAEYRSYGISDDDVEMYLRDEGFRNFFDAVRVVLTTSGKGEFVRTASNYITTDLAKIIRDSPTPDAEENHEILIVPNAFAELITMVSEGQISSRGAKDILAILAGDGGDPSEIAKTRGMLQESNADALRPAIQELLKEHPAVVADYRAGKEQAVQFLVGQGMRVTKGAANPTVLRELILELISETK